MPKGLMSAAMIAGLVMVSGCADERFFGASSSAPPTARAADQGYCIGPYYAGGTACASIANPYESNPTKRS